MDRGLSNSRWAPVSSYSRQPYYFNKKNYSASNSTSTSTSLTSTSPSSVSLTATAETSQAEAFSSTSSSTHNVNVLASTTNGATQGYQNDIASALRRIPTPWAELERVMKIVRRIKWKFPFLAHGYNAATEGANQEQRDEAELMFKLDFFEYYMLLERALVHLLGVFGIKVTGAYGTRLNNVRADWEQSDHRFHANVLEALADARNPLHEALGQGDGALALSRAKEREFCPEGLPTKVQEVDC